jgi:hypothetical protein
VLVQLIFTTALALIPAAAVHFVTSGDLWRTS